MSIDRGTDIAPDAPGFLAPSPPKPPRVWTVFVAFVVVLGGVLVGSAVLAVVLVALEEGDMPSMDELEARLGRVLLTPTALIASVCLSVFWLTSTSFLGSLLSPQPFADRLRLRRLSVPVLAYPVSIVGLLAVGQTLEYVAIRLGFREERSAIDVIAEAVASMPQPSFVLFLIAGSLGAGVAEELFFRGYMQTRLTSRWGVVAGIIVSSAAFALLHLDPLHSSLAFFMGLYMGWLAERSGTVLLPIVAHVGNNCIAFSTMRVSETSSEAPLPYLAISATLALICVLVIGWLVRPTTNGTPSRV